MSVTIRAIAIDEIRFVKELYPRLREDDATIERYRDAIDLLPPVKIARDGILVDGFHRWQARRREKLTTIDCEDLGNLSDAEIVRESIKSNASHGYQLSQADKRRLASELWGKHFAAMPPAKRKAEIAALLSISEDAVERATKDARQAEQADREAAVLDMWLNCYTQDAIADALTISQQTVSNWLSTKFPQLREIGKPPGSSGAPDDWGNIQHFDIWDFPRPEGDSSYFGRMPAQVVQNLLWAFTEPGATVFDPFAGGGTTIDVAKAMGRRVWSSDLVPSTPNLPIHAHNILDGWPAAAPGKVDLILLDPPYWQQAKGRYSELPADLGNQTLEEFYASWAAIVATCRSHLNEGGRLAYIISPTQRDDGSVVDHAAHMMAACSNSGLSIERRIIVPYQTQQATGQQVTWARENKRFLKLYRDLVIFRSATDTTRRR